MCFQPPEVPVTLSSFRSGLLQIGALVWLWSGAACLDISEHTLQRRSNMHGSGCTGWQRDKRCFAARHCKFRSAPNGCLAQHAGRESHVVKRTCCGRDVPVRQKRQTLLHKVMRPEAALQNVISRRCVLAAF